MNRVHFDPLCDLSAITVNVGKFTRGFLGQGALEISFSIPSELQNIVSSVRADFISVSYIQFPRHKSQCFQEIVWKYS